MPNQTVKVAFQSFQQKLDAFKNKIQLQQLLAQSLMAEFDSLTSEFESLKGLIGTSLQKFESTSADFDATSCDFESTSENLGATSYNFESSSEKIGATSSNFESSSYQNGATSIKPEFSLPKDGAARSIRELASLFQRAARVSLKIYYSQPNIPSRIGEILLALKEKKRLSIAEMRQITGVSRNSLVRDIKVLKLLGWLEFHGSRKNGYFTLTASFPVS